MLWPFAHVTDARELESVLSIVVCRHVIIMWALIVVAFSFVSSYFSFTISGTTGGARGRP